MNERPDRVNIISDETERLQSLMEQLGRVERPKRKTPINTLTSVHGVLCVECEGSKSYLNPNLVEGIYSPVEVPEGVDISQHCIMVVASREFVIALPTADAVAIWCQTLSY
jgi:hypothetical protein